MEQKKSLFNLTAQMAAIEQILEENGGEMTEELEQAWSETAETLPVKVDGYATLINKYNSAVAACKAEIDRVTAIKKSAENSVKRLKDHVQFAMEQNGFDKLEGTTSKFSLAKAPVSTLADEDKLLEVLQGKILGFKEQLPDWVDVKISVSKSKLKELYYGKDFAPAGVTFVDDAKTLRIK